MEVLNLVDLLIKKIDTERIKMGDLVLASMLSAFAIICLMVALVVGFVTFMIDILFEKDVKRDKCIQLEFLCIM